MATKRTRPARVIAGAQRAPWWSSSASQRLAKLVTLLLLELLPIEAVLLVFTGYSGKSITQTPIPFWFLFGALLLAWAIGRYLTGGSLPRLLIVSLPVFIPCVLLLIRVSPAAYGSAGSNFFDWSWILGLNHDLAVRSPQATAITPLLILFIYIWWRGLRLGSDPPEYVSVTRVFKYGVIVMVSAVAASIAIPGVVRQQVVGALGLLLPMEVFCGLIAIALARISMNHAEQPDTTYVATSDRLWFGAALTLAGLIVCFAVLLNLVINYQSVGAILSLFGPLGTVVNALTTFLVAGLAQVLHVLFDWLIQPFKASQDKHATVPTPIPTRIINTHHHTPQIPDHWLVIAGIVLEGAAVLVIVVLFLWLMRTIVIRRRPNEKVLDEERESLDAKSMFGTQLRALLAGLRQSAAAPWHDPLTPGSVRYLYRGVLETAGQRGLARGTAETPDEFSARLAASPLVGTQTPEDQQRLATLSEVYDSTRYAEDPPPEQVMPPLREQAKKLLERLTRKNS